MAINAPAAGPAGITPTDAPPERGAGRALSEPGDVLGQNLIVLTRWVLVVSGVIITMWDPGAGPWAIARVRAQVTLLLILAVGNFALHAQLLLRRPTARVVAQAASWADLAAITGLVLLHGDYAGDGPISVFYFPALLAIGVAFERRAALSYAAVAIGAFGAICALPALMAGTVVELAVRLMMMGAVAGVGLLFRALEAQRPPRGEDEDQRRAAEREQAEDLYYGQTVIVWARWAVVLGAAALALWTVDSMAQIVAGTALVIALSVVNGFLHVRLLVGRPANTRLLLAASALDVAAVAALAALTTVPVWACFALLYPLLLASAFVYRPRVALAYTGLVMALPAAGALLLGGLQTVADWKLLVLRLITLAATGGLGAYYWRMSRTAPGRAVAVAA